MISESPPGGGCLQPTTAAGCTEDLSKEVGMSDIDDVLERLVTDEGFRAALADDPAAALTGYSLGEEDLEILAATLDEGGVEEHGVEQRTSKSALLGLIAGLADGGGGSSPKADADLAAHETTNEAGDQATSKRVTYYAYELTNVQEEGVEALAAPEPGVDDGTQAPVVTSWDQMLVSKYMPGDTPSPGAPADLAEGGAGTVGAGGSGEGAQGPSGVRELPGNEADSPSTRKGFEGQIELTSFSMGGHNPPADDPLQVGGADARQAVGAQPDDTPSEAESDEPDPAGRAKVQFHWDTSTEDTDTPSLAEDDRPGDLRTPEEDVEPALNAYARLTANGTAVGDAPIEDLADVEDPARPEGTTSDDEVMYVPVRRSAGPGADDLAEPDASIEAQGNEVPIEPVTIPNEGLDPTSDEPTIEVVGGIDVSSDVVEGDGDPEAPEAQGEPTRD
jgi:hypothetical protein